MLKSESIINLVKALSKAQSEFNTLQKKGYNNHLKYAYATLDDMKNATMPALKENGLSLNFFPETENGVNYMGAILMHVSGEFVCSRYIVAPEKTGMQGMGSAFTYLKRYMWGSIFSLYDDENDDAAEENADTKKSDKRKEIAAIPLTDVQLKYIDKLLIERGLDMYHVLDEFDMEAINELTQDKLTDFVRLIKEKWKKI